MDSDGAHFAWCGHCRKKLLRTFDGAAEAFANLEIAASGDTAREPAVAAPGAEAAAEQMDF